MSVASAIVSAASAPIVEAEISTAPGCEFHCPARLTKYVCIEFASRNCFIAAPIAVARCSGDGSVASYRVCSCARACKLYTYASVDNVKHNSLSRLFSFTLAGSRPGIDDPKVDRHSTSSSLTSTRSISSPAQFVPLRPASRAKRKGIYSFRADSTVERFEACEDGGMRLCRLSTSRTTPRAVVAQFGSDG
jgi:hypothetical protein